jgi:hypothetical protein
MACYVRREARAAKVIQNRYAFMRPGAGKGIFEGIGFKWRQNMGFFCYFLLKMLNPPWPCFERSIGIVS